MNGNKERDGGMDGQEDDGQMGGWTYGARLKDGWMDGRQKDGWINGQMDGYTCIEDIIIINDTHTVYYNFN